MEKVLEKMNDDQKGNLKDALKRLYNKFTIAWKTRVEYIKFFPDKCKDWLKNEFSYPDKCFKDSKPLKYRKIF